MNILDMFFTQSERGRYQLSCISLDVRNHVTRWQSLEAHACKGKVESFSCSISNLIFRQVASSRNIQTLVSIVARSHQKCTQRDHKSS
jgi:hypothetical protein